MKIQLTYLVIALILLFNVTNTLKFDNTFRKMHSIKSNMNIKSNSNSIINKNYSKLLNFTRNHYQNTEISAENFLHEISRLVISDFEVLRKNNLKGITFEILRDMIHNDKDFGNNVTDEELQKKFVEYDVFDKGYLDKVTYSGIMSEFMLAKAALKKLSKFIDEPFEDPLGVISTNFTDIAKINPNITIVINNTPNSNNYFKLNNNTNITKKEIPISNISEKVVTISKKDDYIITNTKSNNIKNNDSKSNNTIYDNSNILVISNNNTQENHQVNLDKKTKNKKEIDEKLIIPEKKENSKFDSNINTKIIDKKINNITVLLKNNTNNKSIKKNKPNKTELNKTNNNNHNNKINETNKENQIILNNTVENIPTPKVHLIEKNEVSKVLNNTGTIIPIKPTTPGIQINQKEFKDIINHNYNNITYTELNNTNKINKTTLKPIVKSEEIIKFNITKELIVEIKKPLEQSIIVKNHSQIKKNSSELIHFEENKQNINQPIEIQKNILKSITNKKNDKNNSTKKLEQKNFENLHKENTIERPQIIIPTNNENQNKSLKTSNITENENINKNNSNLNSTNVTLKRKLYTVISTIVNNGYIEKNKESQNYINIDNNSDKSFNYNFKKDERTKNLRNNNIKKI
jgi:hypothetical protein